MLEQSTLTVRLPSETEAKLKRLAEHTRRTRTALAEEALASHVEREFAIVEAIERGRDEIGAGRGLDTDEVFRDVEAAIADVEASRSKP